MSAFLLVFVGVSLFTGSFARECCCIATRGGWRANVRSCGSTGCSVVDKLSPGTCMTTTGQSQADGTYMWYEMTLDGKSVWARNDVVSGPQKCGNDGTSTACFTRPLCFNWRWWGWWSNTLRGCDAGGLGCGNYGASRGSRTHTGNDITCQAGSSVYAPISGTLTRAWPYQGKGRCCNAGFTIRGTGIWTGYTVKVFYCQPYSSKVGQSVSKGEAVCTHIGLSTGCTGRQACYGSSMTDHSHLQLDYNGNRLDPSSWLLNC